MVQAPDNKTKKKVDELLKSFPVMAEGSGRNVALTKVIGKIVKLVQPKDHFTIAYPMALSANKLFKTPLKEQEVSVIFNSIAKKEAKKPLADIDFIKTKEGEIISNVENIYRTLKADEQLAGAYRFNTFAGLVESKFSREEFSAFQRIDVIRLRNYLMSTYQHFARVAHGDVEDAMIRAAEDCRISPPVEWLKGLEWDKVARLDKWLVSVYGVPDDEYHRAVGSNWLKGLVQRLVWPGSKFDYVLVLEGAQGIRKSTSLAVLGGRWHVETVFSPDNKDFFMLFSEKAIVEFSEGETLSRTEAKRLKAVITMQHDKYRPPYERAAKEFPRQCVFAMTTNQEQYLKDETGNRRWLPVAVQKPADIEWLAENREQLFAEAYHRVITKKETTYEFPEEETRLQQSMRQTTDPREELIFEWYFTALKDEHREAGITTRMAYQGTTGMGFGNGKEMGKMEEMIIGDILRKTLKLDKKRAMEKNSRFYKYFPTPETMAMAPDAKNIIDPAQIPF
jgi:putative DNA primase/helicase